MLDEIFKLDVSPEHYSASLFRLKDGEDPLKNEVLLLAFGGSLPNVLAEDPAPMLFKARHLLDPYEGMYLGKPAFYFGKNKYGFIVTLDVWEREFVPSLTGAPHFPGHQTDTYEAELGHLKWVGLDDGVPSALIYPTDEDYRRRLRLAAAQGVLSKTFPVSLAMQLQVKLNRTTGKKEVVGVQRKDQVSLDLVRWTGTERARIEEPELLNSGKVYTMLEIKVESLSDLLTHKDTQRLLQDEVSRLMQDPETRKKLFATATVAELSEVNAEVKKLSERKSREDVLKSITKDDLPVLKEHVLSNEELRGAVAGEITSLNEEVKKFVSETAKPILEAKLGAELAAAQLAANDFSHCDETRVHALGDAVVSRLGVDAISVSKGKSQKKESGVQAQVVPAMLGDQSAVAAFDN